MPENSVMLITWNLLKKVESEGSKCHHRMCGVSLEGLFEVGLMEFKLKSERV